MVVAPNKNSYEENYWEYYREEEDVQKPKILVKKKKKLRILPITVVILSFVFLNMGIAIKTAGISMANIELDNLNQQLKTIENEKSVLLLEVARLKSVDRVELAAKNSMEMIYASEAPTVRIKGTAINAEAKISETINEQKMEQTELIETTWSAAFLNWFKEKAKLNLDKVFQG